MSPIGRLPSRYRPARRCTRGALVVGLAVASATVTLPLLGGPAQAASGAGEPGIKIIQANLLSPQSYQRFQRDAAKVLRQSPDLITYNEVSFRRDEYLAPQGYQLWRLPRDRFTKATPVAWREDRFDLVARGTRMISDWRGRPPGRTIEIGRRQANWVTLRTGTGRVLSVVSVHLAPRSKGMPDLHRRSVRRLCALVEDLAVRGPVLIGGDFNVPVGGSRYQHEQYAGAQMKSTYQILGNKFGTSDHGNGQATIDYVFIRGTDQLRVRRHYPLELRSDHDAVVAKFSWKTDPPSSTTRVVNDPTGTRRERRAVVSTVAGVIRGTQAGELVQVATSGTDLRAVERTLMRAEARGVRVQLTTRSRRLSDGERRLASSLGAGSLVRCTRACAREWEATHSPSMVLVSDSEDQPRVLVEVSRRLRPGVIARRTRATVQTGGNALEQARSAFSG